MGIGGRTAVFLDRDGVINRAIVQDGKPYPPPSAAALEIPSEVPAALRRLRLRGLLLIVVTNQPDVARRKTTRASVEEIHDTLARLLPLDDIFTCFHSGEQRCACRKPKPGLLLKAARSHGIALEKSFLVGDRWRDILAGHKAGCRTVWIDRGYSEPPPQPPAEARVLSLAQAAQWILQSLDRRPLPALGNGARQ